MNRETKRALDEGAQASFVFDLVAVAATPRAKPSSWRPISMATSVKSIVPATAGVPVGAGDHVHPATFLLMCGYLVHVATKADAGARADARLLLDGILTAARIGGFHRADLLETLMSRNERTDRLRNLAHAAVDAIGDTDAFLFVLRAAGANVGADQ
jgi:hypothetical protein